MEKSFRGTNRNRHTVAIVYLEEDQMGYICERELLHISTRKFERMLGGRDSPVPARQTPGGAQTVGPVQPKSVSGLVSQTMNGTDLRHRIDRTAPRAAE